MKQFLRWVVWMMCIAWLLSLFGCGKKEPQMLDGPGMEYVPNWTEFTLSRSDSYAQYNFSFTVTDTDSDPLVSGTCRDEDGNEYDVPTGIVLTGDTIWTLRRMNLEQLPDAVGTKDDQTMLDGSNITCSLTQEDGTVTYKQVSTELSYDIYQLLLPHFMNHQSS